MCCLRRTTYEDKTPSALTFSHRSCSNWLVEIGNVNMTPPHSVEKEGKVSARHTTLRPPRGLRVCGNSAGPRRWVRTGCGAAVVTCRRPYGASTELNAAKWVLSAQRGGVLDSARLDDHYRQLAGVSHRGGAPSAKTGGAGATAGACVSKTTKHWAVLTPLVHWRGENRNEAVVTDAACQAPRAVTLRCDDQ